MKARVGVLNCSPSTAEITYEKSVGEIRAFTANKVARPLNAQPVRMKAIYVC